MTNHTQQTPRTYKRYPLNGSVVVTPRRRIQCKSVEVNGKVYTVPTCIYRRDHSWDLHLLGRFFKFHDDRHDPDPDASLDRAIQYLTENDHITSAAQFPPIPHQESRIKNVEFGVAGIDIQWRLNSAKEYRFTIRVRKLVDAGPANFSVSLRPDAEGNIDPQQVSKNFAKALYMVKMCEDFPMLEISKLRQMWKHLKDGVVIPTDPEPDLPEYTLIQIAKNLEYIKSRNAGDGWVDQRTNKYVF